jgi:hypothetical protein
VLLEKDPFQKDATGHHHVQMKLKAIHLVSFVSISINRYEKFSEHIVNIFGQVD